MNPLTRILVVLLLLACASPSLARIEPLPGDRDIGQVRSLESVLPELARFGRVRVGCVEIRLKKPTELWAVTILHFAANGEVDYRIQAQSLKIEWKEGSPEVRLHLGRGSAEGERGILWFDKRTETLVFPRDWRGGKSPPARP